MSWYSEFDQPPTAELQITNPLTRKMNNIGLVRYSQPWRKVWLGDFDGDMYLSYPFNLEKIKIFNAHIAYLEKTSSAIVLTRRVYVLVCPEFTYSWTSWFLCVVNTLDLKQHLLFYFHVGWTYLFITLIVLVLSIL